MDMPDFWLVAYYVDGLLSPIWRIVKAQELPSLESARKPAIKAKQALSEQSDTVEVTVRTEREMMDRIKHLLELTKTGSIQQQPLQQSYHQPHQQQYQQPQ